MYVCGHYLLANKMAAVGHMTNMDQSVTRTLTSMLLLLFNDNGVVSSGHDETMNMKEEKNKSHLLSHFTCSFLIVYVCVQSRSGRRFSTFFVTVKDPIYFYENRIYIYMYVLT